MHCSDAIVGHRVAACRVVHRMLGGNLDSQKENFPQIQLKDIVGTWTIHLNTLPIWLAGDKLSPTLTYTQDPSNCRKAHDTVEYREKSGKVSKIVGTDTQDENFSARFLWRGRGLLCMITSEWYFLYVDAEEAEANIRLMSVASLTRAPHTSNGSYSLHCCLRTCNS